MSNNFLISLIVITAALLAFVIYSEVQQSREVRALESQVNEVLRVAPTYNTTSLSILSSSSEDSLIRTDLFPKTETPVNVSTSDETSDANSSAENEADTPVEDSNADTPSSAPAQPSESPSTTVVCSSFDEAGLFAAFDNALAAFIADASSSYGDQYENLQYQLSSKTATITEEQGTVTTNYSGTVKELSTGENVSANGTIVATFNWDGCAWQVLEYSF